MNFVKFDELVINLDRISAYRLRQNKNDGSFRNKDDYPYVAEFYSGGGKPFTVHLTESMTVEFKRLVSAKGLIGERR